MSETTSITEPRPAPAAPRHSPHLRINVEQASYAYSARKKAAPLFTLEATAFQAREREFANSSKRFAEIADRDKKQVAANALRAAGEQAQGKTQLGDAPDLVVKNAAGEETEDVGVHQVTARGRAVRRQEGQ